MLFVSSRRRSKRFEDWGGFLLGGGEGGGGVQYPITCHAFLVASSKFFLKLNWCDLGYFFFFSELCVTMVQNDLTEILLNIISSWSDVTIKFYD